jgi:hypothetical protein
MDRPRRFQDAAGEGEGEMKGARCAAFGTYLAGKKVIFSFISEHSSATLRAARLKASLFATEQRLDRPALAAGGSLRLIERVFESLWQAVAACFSKMGRTRRARNKSLGLHVGWKVTRRAHC